MGLVSGRKGCEVGSCCTVPPAPQAVFGQEIVSVRATERGHIATGSGSGSLSLWTRRGDLLRTRRGM